MAGQGMDAPAYHASLPSDQRIPLEQQLLRNEVKALVATVALEMGFDKPDLGFVVHYQRPGSVIAYYQQIGRAGRALDNSFAILLNGSEDDEIQDYFIRSAFPPGEQMREVISLVESSGGETVNGLLGRLNLSRTRIEQCLKFLEIEGAVVREGSRYWRTVNAWVPDELHAQRMTQIRRQELQQMQTFVSWTGCLMEFLERELDDPNPQPCGLCAGCGGDIISSSADSELVRQAASYLKSDSRWIEPKSQWPALVGLLRHGRIEASLRGETGRALSIYGDAGWGRTVEVGKYRDGRFNDELVQAAEELIRNRWHPRPAPTWVTSVPSLRRPNLVPNYAQRLAARLGLPFRQALVKTEETLEQKGMENSAQQVTNIQNAFRALPNQTLSGPALLVDDIVDSGWTLALCGVLLREAGSGVVHPFALASAVGTRKPS